MAEFMLQILVYDETMFRYDFLGCAFLICCCSSAESAYGFLDPPKNVFGGNPYKIHCCVINEYLEHEFSHGTYLEL